MADAASDPQLPAEIINIETRGAAWNLAFLYEQNFLKGHADSKDPAEKAIFARALVVAKSFAGLHTLYDQATSQSTPQVTKEVMHWGLANVHIERTDMLQLYREGKLGAGDEKRVGYLKQRLKDAFQNSRFQKISTWMRNDWIVPYYWFSDAAQTAEFKGDNQLLFRALDIMVAKGGLREVLLPEEKKLYGLGYGRVWQVVDFDLL